MCTALVMQCCTAWIVLYSGFARLRCYCTPLVFLSYYVKVTNVTVLYTIVFVYHAYALAFVFCIKLFTFTYLLTDWWMVLRIWDKSDSSALHNDVSVLLSCRFREHVQLFMRESVDEWFQVVATSLQWSRASLSSPAVICRRTHSVRPSSLHSQSLDTWNHR